MTTQTAIAPTVTAASINRHRIDFDGTGYKNGRGSSQYWGVSRSPESVMSYDWRLNIPLAGGVSKSISPSFAIKESEAAWVASYFYENPTASLPLIIRSEKSPKVEYRITADNTIHRFHTDYPSKSAVSPIGYVPPRTAGKLPVQGTSGLDNTKPSTVTSGLTAKDLTTRQAALLREMVDVLTTETSSEKFKAAIRNVASIDF